jgi:hypothetical protein
MITNGSGTLSWSNVVSNVGLSLPASLFNVTTASVTTAGTLTAALTSQTANYVFAAPNGSAGVPNFRTLVAADLPTTSVAPGSYGGATSVATFTVDAYGRLTTAGGTAIAITFSQVTDIGAWSGSTSLVTLGTITSGSWHGSTIAYNYGGTGVSAPGVLSGNLRWNGTAYTIDTTTYATTASPVFTGTVTLPIGLSGTLIATAGIVSVLSGNNLVLGNGSTIAQSTFQTANTNLSTVTGYTSLANMTSLVGLANPGSTAHLQITSSGAMSWDTSVYLTAAVTSVNSMTGPGITLAGTTSQVNVANGTNTVTFSLPQNIATTSSPTFASVTVTNAPSVATDAANKSYVDNAIIGLRDYKESVDYATTTNFASLSGLLTVDGTAVVAGQRILVMNQATASQNGIYIAGSGAWSRSADFTAGINTSVTVGLYVYVAYGAANGQSGFVLSASNASAPDTSINVGTDTITFTKFAGASVYTSGTGIYLNGTAVNVGNFTNNGILVGAGSNASATVLSPSSQYSVLVAGASGVPGWGSINLASTTAVGSSILAVANGGTNLASFGTLGTAILTYTSAASGFVKWSGSAFSIDTSTYLTTAPTITLTGAVTGTGTFATTLSAAAVGLSNLATLAANSVIGNSTGSSATPTAVSMLTTATASSVALRDANANLSVTGILAGYTATATAAGTTTLTVGSAYRQFFTGTTTQTVQLPVTSTLTLGQSWYIQNSSSGVVTLNSSGANAVLVLASGTAAIVTCVLTSGTTAGSWSYSYFDNAVASGKKFAVNSSVTFTGTDGVTITLPTTSATMARTDAAQTFTGTQTFSSAPTFSSLTTKGVLLNSAAGVISSSAGSASNYLMADGSTVANTVVNPTTTIGDLILASSTATPAALSRLAAVASGAVLASAGTGTAPTWSTGITLTGAILSSGGGLGYTTGAGGTVTQATSRTTGVTLSKLTGRITLFSTSLASNNSQSFVLTNTFIAATDCVIVQHISAGTLGLYSITVTPAAGSCTITVRNNTNSGSPTEAPVLQFVVLKAVTA